MRLKLINSFTGARQFIFIMLPFLISSVYLLEILQYLNDILMVVSF
jgi:hypothetical protein